MIWRALVLLAMLPSLAQAQDFSNYQATTPDALFDQWNEITKRESPGISFPNELQKIRFVATLQSFPAPCSNADLESVLRVINLADVLRQVSVTNCFGFSSDKGRNVVAYVEDLLVPGLKSDAKLGGHVELYAIFPAYIVQPDRSRNYPILLVTAFEPK
jgi:hypothetical protein